MIKLPAGEKEAVMQSVRERSNYQLERKLVPQSVRPSSNCIPAEKETVMQSVKAYSD